MDSEAELGGSLLGFNVLGLGFEVLGLGFEVLGLGFHVLALGLAATTLAKLTATWRHDTLRCTLLE